MSLLGRLARRLKAARWRSVDGEPGGTAWWARRSVRFGLPLLAVGAVGFDAWLLTCGFNGCPGGAEVRRYQPPEGGRVLDRQGRFIGRLTSVKRVNVPLSRVPRHVRLAFVATEDRRFLQHRGVDWRGFARALVRNARAMGVREGFSTITMQAARTSFLTEREALRRSLGRKFIELRLAQIMERHLTKDQILEVYLNAIYLGNGAYGVDAASRDLFGKRVAELNTSEGAMLAALAKGPATYSPRKDFDRALARRNLVLDLMRREGYLRDDAWERARDRDLEFSDEGWRPPQPNASFALDAVRALVDSVLRARGEEMSDLVVQTTLDLVAQRAGERAVRVHAERIERETQAWSGRDAPLQGAMVAVDPRTGDIRAMVGGRQYERGGFNRALNARRQPGSAFKPFVYAAALATGFTPATVVDDEPVEVESGDQVWAPANYGGEYRGPVTLRRALAQSANAATVRVSRSVGERRVAAAANRNGIVSHLAAVPAIALGAVEVTPLELVAAYSPFANGGFRVTPRLVTRIERRDKTAVYAQEMSRELVMDERDAYQLTSMLRSVVDEGTGRAVRARGVTGPVAGKTGTTNGGTDVWFVGYTPTVVAGFWFGYDRPAPLGDAVNGGRYAAPAWADFYRTGWSERARGNPWRTPAGLVSAEIDPETGLLADAWCPTRRTEWFKAGTEPTRLCEGHDHAPSDLIGDLIAQFETDDVRPLTRALRRIIERAASQR